MKTKIKFNKKGIQKCIEFMAKYHKNYSEDKYEFNIDAAIDEMFDKSTDSESLHYELSSYESINGCPQTINFKHEDYEHIETDLNIRLDDISYGQFYDQLLINNITHVNYCTAIRLYDFFKKSLGENITLNKAITEASKLFVKNEA